MRRRVECTLKCADGNGCLGNRWRQWLKSQAELFPTHTNSHWWCQIQKVDCACVEWEWEWERRAKNDEQRTDNWQLRIGESAKKNRRKRISVGATLLPWHPCRGNEASERPRIRFDQDDARQVKRYLITVPMASPAKKNNANCNCNSGSGRSSNRCCSGKESKGMQQFTTRTKKRVSQLGFPKLNIPGNENIQHISSKKCQKIFPKKFCPSSAFLVGNRYIHMFHIKRHRTPKSERFSCPVSDWKTNNPQTPKNRSWGVCVIFVEITSSIRTGTRRIKRLTLTNW